MGRSVGKATIKGGMAAYETAGETLARLRETLEDIAVEAATAMLTAEGSPLTASMLRDIEGGGSTEGEHVLGDLAERAARLGVPTPILRLARCHVAAYEARRAREHAGA